MSPRGIQSNREDQTGATELAGKKIHINTKGRYRVLVSSVTNGISTETDEQGPLRREGNNDISSYYFYVTRYQMLSYTFSLNP